MPADLNNVDQTDINTLCKCQGGHPILNRRLTLNSKISMGNFEKR